MRETLRRIRQDIIARRNIEAYAFSIAAFIVAVVGLVNDLIPQNVQTAIMLATLGLLVFHTTIPERDRDSIETVLRDRRKYNQSFVEMIDGARALWIYGASNINILRNHGKDIRKELLQKGGTLRMILQNPNHRPGMDILMRQLDDLNDLERDIQSSIFTLNKMVEQFGSQVEYRFLDYSPGFSMVVVDRDKRDGMVIVEFYGYHNDEIDERMHIEISPNDSPLWFERWAQQYELMWNAATAAQSVDRKTAEN